MFENSLLDSGKREQTRRGAATLLSLAIQGVFVAALIVAPMFYTDVLPGFRLQAETIAMPIEPPPPLGRPDGRGGSGSAQAPMPPQPPDDVLRQPGEIPVAINMDPAPAPPRVGGGPGDGSNAPWGFPDGVVGGTGMRPLPVLPGPSVPPRVRLSPSVLDRGHLVRKVMPQYPEIARKLRLEGQVVLQAVIGRDGNMQMVRVLRGHAMLAPAAEDAVRQWQYRPYILNGHATEVETQITVNFVLSR
jgi:protein TonB